MARIWFYMDWDIVVVLFVQGIINSTFYLIVFGLGLTILWLSYGFFQCFNMIFFKALHIVLPETLNFFNQGLQFFNQENLGFRRIMEI